MKKKKTLKKGFNINKILIFIAVIIACNISVLYVNADQSSAEIPVDVPDQNVTVDITNGVKEFTDAVECYMYAEASLLASTCSSTITGFVKGSWAGKVMVHQTMDNTRYFDNNGVRYSTSTSLKQGSLGKNNYQRTVFNPKDADAKVYKIVTNTANNGVPNFSNVNWQAYTQAEYEKEFGSVPGKLMYLVRKSTVEKIETFEKTADGGYHVVLQLNKARSFQTILTSHNTYLMQNRLTRPDCCYIMTNERITNLFDSTDKEIREAHNLEKMYRNGAFQE